MRRLLLVLLLLGLAVPCWAAIDCTVDTPSSATADNDADGVLTFSHTVNGDYLVVPISFNNAGSQTVSGVTFNGVAMANIGSDLTNASGYGIYLWGLAAPASGAHNVVITGSTNIYYAAGAYSCSGVHQTVSVGTFASAQASADAGPATVAVTSAVGEVVVDVVSVNGATLPITVGAGQTQKFNTSSVIGGASSTEAGAASVTMSWTFTSGGHWAIGGIPLKPAAAGATAKRGMLLGVGP